MSGKTSRLVAREASLRARERAVDLRELAVKAREASLGAPLAFQLREANEHLLVASVNAQAKVEVVEHIASHDFLTGLPNRALLAERLALSTALAQRHGGKVALLFVDLDHFKEFNDSLGHGAGDELLRSTAKRLSACVRGADTVSRLGGDEFVVLLTDIHTLEGATQTAQKLLEAMAEPHLVGGQWVSVSLSIGISVLPDDALDVDTVLTNADAAMYQAKRRGGNSYQVYGHPA
jgi:diguanylate cyclase (GGDEF)-like protein